MQAPEPLTASHQLEGFDCGVDSLNQWLQRRALINQLAGVSRTSVLCEQQQVRAYSSLAAGSIVLADVPGALRRNMPNPLPVVVLGRLAVDRRQQGQGVGRALVAHAIRQSLQAQRLIGARALLVHALDERAAAFYRSLGFRPSPISPLTLMLQLVPPDQPLV
jgi:GNAT superfamily N-acetyltransferase